jgi:hypothetical protein
MHLLGEDGGFMTLQKLVSQHKRTGTWIFNAVKISNLAFARMVELLKEVVIWGPRNGTESHVGFQPNLVLEGNACPDEPMHASWIQATGKSLSCKKHCSGWGKTKGHTGKTRDSRRQRHHWNLPAIGIITKGQNSSTLSMGKEPLESTG